MVCHKNYNHAKNEVAYSKKSHLTIVEQVQGGVKEEWGKKWQNFVTFYIYYN
jgi:hypothetical protein